MSNPNEWVYCWDCDVEHEPNDCVTWKKEAEADRLLEEAFEKSPCLANLADKAAYLEGEIFYLTSSFPNDEEQQIIRFLSQDFENTNRAISLIITGASPYRPEVWSPPNA